MSSIVDKICQFFGGREECERVARECGLVERESKFGGTEFLLTFTHGICGVQEATLAQLTQFIGDACAVKMTSQSIDGRLTAAAAAFMRAILTKALSIAATTAGGGVEAFKGVFDHINIADSTNFPLHPALQKAFKGSGGAAAASAMRIQFAMDFAGNEMYIKVGDVRLCDAPTLREIVDGGKLPSGGKTLWMADLGYASQVNANAIADDGGSFLFKANVGTNFVAPDGTPVQLAGILQEKPVSVEIPVSFGGRTFRLVGQRLPEEMANRAIQKAREARRKGGHDGDISPWRKLAANYLMFITNLPADEFPVTRLIVLYKVRWQIELVFKTWKSLLQLNVIRTAKLHRVECEVYGKLIMAVMLTVLSRESFRLHAGSKPSRRTAWLSLHKAIRLAKVFIAMTWARTACTNMTTQKIALLRFMRDIRDRASKSYCARKPSIEMLLENPEQLFLSGKYVQAIP